MSGTKIIIVGGVAGGASAAARARRLSEDAEIIMFERGPDVSFANCGLPYHIGGEITDRDNLLVAKPPLFRDRFRIDVRTRTEVIGIDREQKQVTVRKLEDDSEEQVAYDKLILSPGAAPVRPPVPGFDLPGVLTLRNLTDMDAIKKIVDSGNVKRALVIGGGYIGLEMAEALRHRELPTTLVELMPQVMGPADPEMVAPLHQTLRLHGVDLRLGTSVEGIEQDGDTYTASLSNGDELECELVILAIGVAPDTGLAKDAGLELAQRGSIKVNPHMQTSDPDIYAVGDAVEVTDFVTGAGALIPLAGPANRQARIAADHIFGRDSAYTATQGTAVCKVFDQTIAMTGASEKILKKLERPYDKVYVHPSSHASYYPGASKLSLKLIFDPEDGKILGAQAVGAKGVDKRIDVLAVAIRAGLTVYDLEHLELSYAPPYGSAKDPVNFAGFVASNALRGDSPTCQVTEVDAPGEDQQVLDVRTKPEVDAGKIGDAMHIPVDEIRDRLGELPRDKELLVYCGVGQRGYVAQRILMQNGFKVRNLTGGITTWKAFHTKQDSAAPPPAVSDTPSPTPEEESTMTANEAPAAPPSEAKVVKDIDACGLQCPGPIMRLNQEIEQIQPGETLTIHVTDPGFAEDVPAWCDSTGNRLVDFQAKDGTYQATITRGEAAPTASAGGDSKHKTLVVFSSDFDRVMAAFVIANGAAAMGSKVTMFFTFWGLNALRDPQAPPVQKTLIENMFGRMMPRGAGRLKLSQMNMLGAGLAMIKGIMKKKKVAKLEELIGSAKLAGVRLVACTMSMDLMGIKKEEMIPGVEEGGVAMYLNAAEKGNVNLFV